MVGTETANCVYCQRLIDLDDEIFWVVNKDQVADEREWRYAHSDCHLARSPGAE